MTPADQPTRACNLCGRTDGGHDSAPDDFVSIAARERWAAGPGGRIAALEAEVDRWKQQAWDDAQEIMRLREFVRRFRSWATTADLNRLAHEAAELLRDADAGSPQ